jgi:hypothetical protein
MTTLVHLHEEEGREGLPSDLLMEELPSNGNGEMAAGGAQVIQSQRQPVDIQDSPIVIQVS